MRPVLYSIYIVPARRRTTAPSTVPGQFYRGAHMDFNTITLKIENGIGHITLRRPDNANALNATMAHE